MSVYRIPTDKSNNVVDGHPKWDVSSVGISEYKENVEFTDILTYKKIVQGTSSSWVTFCKSDGGEVNMTSNEFHKLVPKLVNGRIKGTFKFIKRGNVYRIYSVDEE